MNERKEDRSAKLIEVQGNPEPLTPYPHQLASWDALTKHYEQEQKRAGLLILPTGGGKTRVAARWLLEHWVAHGGRVLWLAHRKELVRQAMDTFAQMNAYAQPKPQLGLMALSSEDKTWSQVGPNEDVVFCTTPTAVRPSNLGFIEHFKLGREKGLFVVLDEAHHGSAREIARLLRTIREWRCPLLGLTATPMRTNEVDQKRLSSLFDESVIYQVTRAELVEKGILAVPNPETVRTSIEFEREFDQADHEHLAKFGDLGERVLERLAKHAGRNKQIVERYKQHAGRYGSTIVFAANTPHAITLQKEFSAAGVDADYVAYTRGDSTDVIRRYKAKEGPSVLINVEMLTEGFDAPHTRTVFLARPTKSEALLTQMVGRALRGPRANGNKEAYLVTFVDTWNEFNPLGVESVLGAGEDVVQSVGEKGGPVELVQIPIELITEAYRVLNSVVRVDGHGVFECLPDAWYVWEQVLEDDVRRQLVMVYEHQRAGYDAMLAAYADGNGLPEELDEDFGKRVRLEFFGDVPDPLPRWTDLVLLLNAHRSDPKPQRYTFKEKESFDPEQLAQGFLSENLGIGAISARILETWERTPACRLAYREDRRSFHEEVMQAVSRLSEPPREAASPKLVEIVREAPATWPEGNRGYSLIELRDAVLLERSHFPKGAPTPQDLSWTKAHTNRYWGLCRYSDRKIFINTTLNSPSVPRFVLEFLLYHELLHLDMPSSGHNSDFRAREYRFVPSEAAAIEARERGFKPASSADAWRILSDQFLDQFGRRFEVGGRAKSIEY